MGFLATLLWLRQPNNHTELGGQSLRKLAEAVMYHYGHKYQRAVDYLQSLANNRFWEEAELPTFPFHEQTATPIPVGEPRYMLHQTILNALAPAVPLRAVFGGDRRQ